MVGSHDPSWPALDPSWVKAPAGPEGSWGRVENVHPREPFGCVFASNNAAA